MNTFNSFLQNKKLFSLVLVVSFSALMAAQFIYLKPQYAVKALLFCGRIVHFETKANTFVAISTNHLDNPANLAEYIRVHFKSIEGFGGLYASVLKQSPYYLSVTSKAASLDEAKENLNRLEQKLQNMLSTKLQQNKDLILIEKAKYKKQYDTLVDVGLKTQQGYNMNLMELASLNKVLYSKLEQATVPGYVSNVKFEDVTAISQKPVSPNRVILTVFILLLSSVLAFVSVLLKSELKD